MTKKLFVQWNNHIQLAISDVDETIAEVYTPADPDMIAQLTIFLKEGRKLFMVTGGSLQRVMRDITDHIKPSLRSGIHVSHCSGAEVWGFMPTAVNLSPNPRFFFSSSAQSYVQT